MIEKEKVFAYITRDNKLLVFEQPDPETGIPYPEAGIQVPGGTIKNVEKPEDAVIREAFEETGLTALRLASFLGNARYEYDLSVYGTEVTHHRYFFHVICEQETPATWRTIETDPSEDPGHVIIFEFKWVQLPDGVPELIAGQGSMLDELIRRMNSNR